MNRTLVADPEQLFHPSVHPFFSRYSFFHSRLRPPVCISPPLHVFSSPVLSAYWWEILAGAREISEMKGAVKNAINCKLIFEIKADHRRPPCRRIPGDFALVEFVWNACDDEQTLWYSFHCAFVFLRVSFCTLAKLIFPSFSQKRIV